MTDACATPPPAPSPGATPSLDAPRLPDRSRTGAVWVSAVGALMLFAAAGVFVAVRWQEMTDAMKLGVLGALTGACLLAGRRLARVPAVGNGRAPLPATGGVLFHLGAFLVPVDIAAVGVHLDTGWPLLLLIEGVTATATWALLGHQERSRVLSAAAAVAAVAAAGGLSATVGSAAGWSVPTSLLVAVLAVGAELAASRVAGPRRAPAGARALALGWAVVAGAAPVLGLVERTVPLHTDVAHLLGLTGRGPSLASALSGALAAAVVGRIARRRGDLTLVVVAAAALVIGVTSAWVELAPGAGADLVGLAAVFLLIEAAAALVAGDAFWRLPGRVAAGGAEIAGGLGCAAGLIGALEGFDPGRAGIAWNPVVAGLLAAAAWLVADLRRMPSIPGGRHLDPWALLTGAGWVPATVGAAAGVLAGVLAGTGPDIVAPVAVALAALAVVFGRSGGHAVAAALVIGAPMAAPGTPVAAATGVAGALVLAGAAVVRAWQAAPPPPSHHPLAGAAAAGRRQVNEAAAWMLAIGALTALAETALVLRWRVHDTRLGELAVLAGLAAASWAAAAVLDRAPAPRTGPPVATVGRAGTVLALAAGAVLSLPGGGGLPPAQLVVLAVLVGALALGDAARLDRPGPLWVLPGVLPTLVVAGSRSATDAWSAAGVALAALALVMAITHVVATVQPDADARWTRPLVATAGVAGLGTAALTAPSPGPFATAVILLGATGILLGFAHGRPELTLSGAALATAGVWLHLSTAGIEALDAYVAPVAVALVVAGWRAAGAGSRVSSWVAYAPAVALLGGAAIVERAAGGAGDHALVAGAVGVVAVVAGGERRLIGPLVTGTAVLVAVTVHESLGVTRQVPTWGWLAIGGATLIAAGVLMERAETGPVETGRRVVDVVHERFS